MSIAERNSEGNKPDGKSYFHIANYIDANGYGGIQKGHFKDAIDYKFWEEPRNLADFLNMNDNAAKLGLKNIQSQVGDNPYNAPHGSIIVVASGIPGSTD